MNLDNFDGSVTVSEIRELLKNTGVKAMEIEMRKRTKKDLKWFIVSIKGDPKNAFSLNGEMYHGRRIKVRLNNKTFNYFNQDLEDKLSFL